MSASRLSPPASRLRKANHGFALLITITLLAFLVVLLIGLAAYTRVETAIAGNTQRQTQARQNALTALNVALGQLQRYAGPDQRVTATADAFGGASATKHYTGVWLVDPSQPASATPMTWLVSGNEFQAGGTPAPLSVTPATSLTTTNSAELVGTHSTGTARDVAAPLVPITTVGAPGVAGSTSVTIGRYAWWVGDQGVKAPVALGDPTAGTAGTNNFNFSPYSDFPDLLSRIRQQISLGAGPADATGAAVLEPRDTNNASLVANQKLNAFNQLAFLKTSANAPLGLTSLQKYFHTWSPNNLNVLANTRLGGLRQDLSLFSPTNPSPLGAAYDAWANYDPKNGGYMEDPTAPIDPKPLQPYSTDPLRRRYVMQPDSSGYGIAPVLTFFGLSFSIRNDLNTSNPTKLEVAARCVVGLWNPYTSSLVPDTSGLQLRVTGLPQVLVTDTAGGSRSVNLQSVMSGGPLNFFLPWTVDGTSDDRSSWLPGRIYNWSASANASDPGGNGNPMLFYERNANQGSGLVRPAGPPLAPSASSPLVYRQCTVSTPTTLKIELYRVSDNTKLAEFNSLKFSQFQTNGNFLQTDVKDIDFAFLFRLYDPTDNATGAGIGWLETAGNDPRESSLPSAAYTVSNGNQPDPTLFSVANSAVSTFDASYDNLILNRDPTGGTAQSYNEDVPVFELPRAPLLSVGALKHFRVSGARPFAIGNSWTSGVQLNGIKADELFDRFYFSGLAPNVTPAAIVNGSLVLPNPLLKVLPRNSSTGASVALSDLQNAPNAQSAKFLLQTGAFNINSADPVAWSSVLRAVRFSTAFDFKYLDVSSTTGTTDDATTAVAGFTGPAFVRFPQSAQEVYKADDTYQQSQFGGGGLVLSTPFYRRGVRTLAANEIASLATAITALVNQRQSVSGPFRHLEEFLNPASPGAPSLLEQAIINANLNANVTYFSSQWLTQGDIMTALAPVLFPRSDTFVIRTYGESVNPVTGATEGRAWCEATVQRVPDYFDTTNAAELAPTDPAFTSINQSFGRRFKIVSFRWLTRSDI